MWANSEAVMHELQIMKEIWAVQELRDMEELHAMQELRFGQELRVVPRDADFFLASTRASAKTSVFVRYVFLK